MHLDLDHADILDFIETPRSELTWVKRCVDIDNGKWQAANTRTKEALLYGIKSGDIWLNKIKHDDEGKRIYGNVCLEVYLPSRGTCLLQHVNLSACSTGNLEQAFDKGMSELCELHGRTGVGATGEYLPADIDRQVGLGVLGLANLLARYKISYSEFGYGLEAVNLGEYGDTLAYELAFKLMLGIQAAADIAEKNNMVRAFAIAPTASCSYKSESLDGFTATPEIAPPISTYVDRDSGTFGVKRYKYGDVEIASEVGWTAYKHVADQLMIMLDNTGLLHGYSFNSWSDVVTYDRNFVEEWLLSPQTSLYYSLQVMGDTQDKTDAYAALDQSEVDDYLQDILNEPVTCDCQE